MNITKTQIDAAIALLASAGVETASVRYQADLLAEADRLASAYRLAHRSGLTVRPPAASADDYFRWLDRINEANSGNPIAPTLALRFLAVGRRFSLREEQAAVLTDMSGSPVGTEAVVVELDARWGETSGELFGITLRFPFGLTKQVVIPCWTAFQRACRDKRFYLDELAEAAKLRAGNKKPKVRKSRTGKPKVDKVAKRLREAKELEKLIDELGL